MKLNNIFRLSAVALVALCASCSNEDIESSSKGMITKTFFATQGESVGTRTAIDANDKSLWSNNDAISVFDTSSANNKFTLSAGGGTNNGTFKGKVNTDGSQWYAIYPYNADATISGNVVSGVTLPTQQVAKAGQFDTNANILTASTTNENLAFKQVTCLVEVTTLAPASKIVFKSNGAEKLAGTLSLTIGADGVATYNVTANGSTEAILVPADGQTSFAAGTYHLCILPQTLTQGITVEVYNADGTSKLVNVSSSSTDKFARAKIIALGDTTGWDIVSLEESEEGNMVDLGLPSGIKWASVNVGAKHPWEFGDYFQWSATEPYHEVQPTENGDVQMKPGKSYYYSNTPYLADDYSSSNHDYDYKLPYTKYTTETDGKTILDHCNGNHDQNGVCDDAACANWSNGWRTPTRSNLYELCEHTYRVYTENYMNTGVKGMIFYKVKNDSHKGYNEEYTSLYNVNSDIHIFFPYGGQIGGTYLSRVAQQGYYWLSETTGKALTTVHDYRDAYNMSFSGRSNAYLDFWERYNGRNIRAVHD